MNAIATADTRGNRQLIVSTLWICIMLNMIVADIFTFMMPGVLQEIMTGWPDQSRFIEEMLLVMAMLIEVPIAMVFLSRVLSYAANRRANMIASVITIVFIIGGGSLTLPYIFFATIEIICAGFIFWYARVWPNPAIEAGRARREVANPAG